nr:sensor histidine kinase [uncultured Actinoplanes sp.]
MNTSSNHRRRGRLDHCALIVDAENSIERLLVPRLRRKIAAEEAVLMVVGARTTAVVRDGLGPDADVLQWVPRDRFYQRLGFTYSRFLRYVREQHAQRRMVHVIAEPDLVADPRAPVNRAAAYLSYESMVNGMFAGYGCPITCIWNSDHHAPPIIDEVRKIHPQEWTARGVVDNPGFVPPDDYLCEQNQPAMTAAPPVTDVDYTVSQLYEVAACRAVVARWAALHHFVPAAVRQVVAAASEVITNGMHHGRPPVRVRAWYQDATLIVQVDDHGGRPIPADAGYRPPTSPADSAGLWVARQLADVLLTRTRGGRTTVRMYFPYAVTHRHLDVPHVM